MTSRINHANLGEVQKTVYLTAIIVSVDSTNDLASIIGVDKCPNATDVPIFYHCEKDSVLRANGALEGAAGAFCKDDEVIVQCEIINASEYKPLYVIGFLDEAKPCAAEYLYLLFENRADTSKTRCLVWNINTDEMAALKTPAGDPIVFPCLSSELVTWMAETIRIGETLYEMGDQCGEEYSRGHDTGGVLVEYPPACLPCTEGLFDTVQGTKVEESGHEPPPWEHVDWTRVTESYMSLIHATKSYIPGSATHQAFYSYSFVVKTLGAQLDCFRTQRQFSRDSEEYESTVFCPGGGLCRTRTIDDTGIDILTHICPLGPLGAITLNYTELFDCDSRISIYPTGSKTKEGITDCFFLRSNEYSEKSAFHFWGVEATVKEKVYNSVHASKSCKVGYELISETIAPRSTSIMAACDSFPSGTDGLDPSGMDRNTDLETAIENLMAQLYTDSGAADNEVLELGIVSHIRE